MSVDVYGTELYRQDKEQPQLFMLVRVDFRSGQKDVKLMEIENKRWFGAGWQVENCERRPAIGTVLPI